MGVQWEQESICSKYTRNNQGGKWECAGPWNWLKWWEEWKSVIEEVGEVI